jgi:hypothetical protein
MYKYTLRLLPSVILFRLLDVIGVRSLAIQKAVIIHLTKGTQIDFEPVRCKQQISKLCIYSGALLLPAAVYCSW